MTRGRWRRLWRRNIQSALSQIIWLRTYRDMATLSRDEARRHRAAKGGKNSKPRKCAACGKHSMSAAVVDDMGVHRRCRSCGHEQGVMYGKTYGHANRRAD